MHYDTPEEANIWIKNKYPERYMRYHFYDFPYKNHKIIKMLIYNLNKICSHLYIRKKYLMLQQDGVGFHGIKLLLYTY